MTVYAYSGNVKQNVVQKEHTVADMKLDRIDINILAELQKNHQH